MMASYKLTYFNFTGLAEPIRFLLSYGGQDFEDVRIEYGGDEWKKLKPLTKPFGVLPTLEIDGKPPVFQHLAIARYLAKKYGIAGDNDLEALEIDAITDTLSDFKSKLYTTAWGDDPDLIAKNYDEASKTTIPFYLGKLNAKAESGYLANGKLSWADLYFIAFFNYFNLTTKFIVVDKYPNLKKVEENVLGIPNIKAWIQKRPKTDF